MLFLCSRYSDTEGYPRLLPGSPMPLSMEQTSLLAAAAAVAVVIVVCSTACNETHRKDWEWMRAGGRDWLRVCESAGESVSHTPIDTHTSIIYVC